MYNSIVANGFLAADPETRQVGSGKVCNVRMCISQSSAKQPCFMDVELWNKQADIAEQYLKKGRAITIQGELCSNSWEHDGKKYNKVFIRGNNFTFLNTGKDKQDQDSSQGKSEGAKSEQSSIDDEIPF